ncbi:hypothetical protein, partial [Acinetobacter baumannii]|uniref:hypothetical protein n=1 Tax=Acinetobacter baumannii TaxID=470 RepID=UPI001BB46DAE
INGVIKADQDDAESVWQELDEYVITRELDQHLRSFFESYLAALDNPKMRQGEWGCGSPVSSGRVNRTF